MTHTFDDADARNDPEQRAANLRTAMDKINSRFGKGTVTALGDKSYEPIPRTSSGCMPLDAALGGGYPKGRIVEIFGPESSGKTTLALHAVAEVQKAGGVACFVDAEHAFDLAYAKALGLDLVKLIFVQPDSGEVALEIVDELCRSTSVDLIVVDSVSALVPRAELEGEIGNMVVGSQARLMSNGLRKLCASASKSSTCLIFINQIRFKIGVMFGSPETTSGGQALKFFASLRIDVRRKEALKNGDDVLGFKTKVKVVKNKVAPPYREAMFDIIFGSGIDSLGGVLDAAEQFQVVTRKGSWYFFGAEKLAQGREKTLVMLRERDDLRQQIEEAAGAALKESPESMGSPEEGEEGGEGEEFVEE